MKYHFVGICGISMSALAVHLRHLGHTVQGSDIHPTDLAHDLEKLGIKVFDHHCKDNVKGCDVLVYNFAIDKNNVEIIYAKKNGIKVISRAELLAQVCAQYTNVIAIAGSHGKTTTSAMLYSCLKYAKLNPTLHIGGIISGEKFGFVEGKNDYFITEACEFHDSFLMLNPTIGVVLNIEPEHLDYFKSFKNEVKSYNKFIKNCKDIVVTNYIDNLKAKETNIIAKNIQIVNHKYQFDTYINDEFFMHIDLNILGRYNIDNALSVIAVCKKLGINKKYIYLGLQNISSVKRRFEIITTSPTLIVHDYAHHPTQIQNTIRTFCDCCHKGKVLVVFQPHTYSRTKAFFNQFLTAFKGADCLFIIKTYPAREKYEANASAFALYKELKKNTNCRYFANFERAEKSIKLMQQKGYNVLILGAGDIEKLAYKCK